MYEILKLILNKSVSPVAISNLQGMLRRVISIWRNFSKLQVNLYTRNNYPVKMASNQFTIYKFIKTIIKKEFRHGKVNLRQLVNSYWIKEQLKKKFKRYMYKE